MTNVQRRAAVHAALGDPHRLGIIDELAVADLTVSELAVTSGLPTNLLAHHLDVLESTGLISRRVSEGDRRRRYVSLETATLGVVAVPQLRRPHDVLFVCTHNSARSQFAAALWSDRTGGLASSAGTDPVPQVHPIAVRAAAEKGIDLSRSVPVGYAAVATDPDLIVSVCDRAREGALPSAPAHLHWSVPDPVADGRLGAFRRAFNDIERRVDRLARSTNKERT